MEDKALSEILSRIRAEAGPAQVLLSPWKRGLTLLPCWGLLLGTVLFIFGLRMDYQELGNLAGGGFSTIQVAVAYGLVTLALRSVIPGSNPSLFFASTSLGAAALLHLIFAIISNVLSPQRAAEGEALHLVLVCLGSTFLLGSVPLIALAVLAKRGLPIRPRLSGILLGMAAGLSSEAAWRMHCPVTSLDHVLNSHTLAILVMIVAGFVLGSAWRKA